MQMPLRGFWAMNAQIVRLRSEEFLENIDLMFVANMNCDGESIEKIRKSHVERMGDPAVFSGATDPDPHLREQHREGIEKLKLLFG